MLSFLIEHNCFFGYALPFKSKGENSMVDKVMLDKWKEDILKFVKKNKKADLITVYLFFLEKSLNIKPVLFLREKTIYQSREELLKKLEKEGKLWRETEIKIQMGASSINEQTKKIYICPFTGKVFGDNTHLNPQDEIYNWVSKCEANTERAGGVRVKRFFVSEDPEIIKNYIVKRKEMNKKVVFSSGITGKLFNSKSAVIDDFTKNQLKSVELIEVPNQNRYQIETHFLSFIQHHLEEHRVAAFVEALSQIEEFSPYLGLWLEETQ